MPEIFEPKYEVIAETNNYIAWKGEDPDSEVSYHIEVGNVMITFYTEEWIEMLDLMRNITKETNKEK